MTENDIAILLLFGLLPLIGAFAFWMKHRRWETMRAYFRREARGVEYNGAAAPDGRTLIELEKLRLADRDKARAMYERLTNQKLDILKTGVAMGYKQEDLSALDARLEKIIGSDRLASLLGEELPSADLSAAGAAGAARQPSSAPQAE